MTRYDQDAKPDDDARSGVGDNKTGEITPLEAAISAKDTRKMHRQAEFAEQVLEERRKRSAEVISHEGLLPVPKGFTPIPGAAQIGIPGPGVLPSGPDALATAPSMRRTKPAPFQRDRISIDHHGKTWGYARADSIKPDDLVVEFGKVTDVESRTIYDEVAGVRAAVDLVLVLTNVTGDIKVVDPDQQLRTFRVHD